MATIKLRKALLISAAERGMIRFTTDVPFQYGPYKFYGLPGLIVKIEDNKGDYIFDLKETKKVAAPVNVQERGSTIAVKRKDYEKQKAKFQKDPISFFQYC